MMEAVRISETSVNFNVIIRRYIPGDCTFQGGRKWSWTNFKVMFQLSPTGNKEKHE
jgi:hypothetical protein